MRSKLLVIGLAAVFAMTGIASANLLTDGDFEAATSGWTTWAWGGGWSNVETKDWGTGSLIANMGAQANGGGGIFQEVAATEGQWYGLTVDSGAEAWWLPTGTMSMIWLDASDVSLGDTTRNTVDPAVYGEDQFDVPHPFETYTMYGQAPAGTVKVKVEFSGNNIGGSVGFDNADLVAVPEPATLGLLGLSGLALWIRRRMI